jgi:hypothetical protein
MTQRLQTYEGGSFEEFQEDVDVTHHLGRPQASLDSAFAQGDEFRVHARPSDGVSVRTRGLVSDDTWRLKKLLTANESVKPFPATDARTSRFRGTPLARDGKRLDLTVHRGYVEAPGSQRAIVSPGSDSAWPSGIPRARLPRQSHPPPAFLETETGLF